MIDRQVNGKRRSGPWSGPQFHVTPVISSNVFNNRQPQAGSSGRARPRLVYPEEPFKNSALILRGDTNAAVDDADEHELVKSTLVVTDTGIAFGE